MVDYRRVMAGVLATSLLAPAADRPADGIQDNSFFVEEAYNQEPGVVQHILNVSWNLHKFDGVRDEQTSLVFTQEWPLFSQTHQFSYTVPYAFLDSDGATENGFEDVLLNYRLQLLSETETRPAMAPRLSLILPTGDENKGLGDGTYGLQCNLAMSKVVADRWSVHGNAGFTWLPGVEGQDLLSYNLGASAIYAVTPDFNLMLEWVGSWGEQVDDDLVGTDHGFATFISPGVRYAFNFSRGAQLVLGTAVPIGLNSEAPDYGVFFYLSFEHGF